MRCPKHKVSQRPRAPVLPAEGGTLLPKGLQTLEDHGHLHRPQAAPPAPALGGQRGLVLQGGLWHGDQHPMWYWELRKTCCRETYC